MPDEKRSRRTMDYLQYERTREKLGDCATLDDPGIEKVPRGCPFTSEPAGIGRPSNPHSKVFAANSGPSALDSGTKQPYHASDISIRSLPRSTLMGRVTPPCCL